MVDQLITCIAVETTGLQSTAEIVEIGWSIFDSEREGTPAGVHVIKPPASVQWERAAYETHEASGLVAELPGGTTIEDAFAQYWQARTEKLQNRAGRMFTLLYSKDQARPVLEDTPFAKLLGWNALDYHTLNACLEVFTVNPRVEAGGKRALDKLLAMREALEKWRALFHLATIG